MTPSFAAPLRLSGSLDTGLVALALRSGQEVVRLVRLA